MIYRREFLTGLGAATLAAAAPAQAPLSPRVNPRLKGVGLSSYSLRDAMRWRYGERTDGELTMEGFFDYAAREGLDAVEPTSYFFPAPPPAGFVAQLRRRAHLLGLDISSAAMGNDFSWPPGSDRGQANLAYAREWIERFADLGAPALRVFASRRPPEGLDDDTLVDNVTANVAEVLPLAERCGVMLGLENHDRVRDPDLLLRIIEQVGSPWLGVCWDSGNLVDTPAPYDHLRRLAPVAAIAQLKTETPVNGEPMPADYPRLARLLVESGYAGYLVLEYEGEQPPREAIPRHVAELRRAIAAIG
ncbi:sugar phosphate isomerase/epimerase family protein [Botrimarina sp.]|uniref:sugar phosphate isomerase/epimerase family protein n=1 Tax=Botrimarina sp. TaxID=2795802 RepID=UPI0032EAE2AF